MIGTTMNVERFRRSRFERHAAQVRWLTIGLIVLSLMILMRALPAEQWLEWLRGRIDGMGVWGPVVLAAIYVLATVLLIPGSVVTLAAGAMFGLVTGLIVVSFGATIGAALAFLIARYAAREAVARRFQRSPKFRAVDRAIAEGGWKIVALLRLSPAIPFNLQNYLYGLTPIRFWPCILTSWLAMLPGTFMYVYLGWVGGEGIEAASGGDAAGIGVWLLRGIGLLATIAVTFYITRLARKALREQTEPSDSESQTSEEDAVPEDDPTNDRRRMMRAVGLLIVAAMLLAFSLWIAAHDGGPLANADPASAGNRLRFEIGGSSVVAAVRSMPSFTRKVP